MIRFRSIALGLLAALAFGASALAQPATFPQPAWKNLLHNPRMDLYPVGTAHVYTPTTISSTLTGISTTPNYFAARWAVWGGTSASVTVSNVSSSLPTGFSNAVKVLRAAANANTTQICTGQEIKTSDVIALQGQSMAVSAWLQAGANFSAASGNITFLVGTGTGTDEGLVTFLSGFAGAATPLSSTTQALTTSWQRLGATFTVPATATEMVVAFCFTPVGTAGSADNFNITGAQLEQGSVVTPLEARPSIVEQALVLPYTFAVVDGAATVPYNSTCNVTTANTTVKCGVALPVTMRAVPATIVETAASFGIWVTAGTAGTCTTLAASSASNTVNSVGVTCTTGGTIALGSATPLIGAATGKYLLVSADF